MQERADRGDRSAQGSAFDPFKVFGNSFLAGLEAASDPPLKTDTITPGSDEKEVTNKKDRNTPSKKLNGGTVLYRDGSKIKTYKEPSSGIQFNPNAYNEHVEKVRSEARQKNQEHRRKAAEDLRGGYIIPAAWEFLQSVPWMFGEAEYYNPNEVAGVAPAPGIGKMSSVAKATKAVKPAKDIEEGTMHVIGSNKVYNSKISKQLKKDPAEGMTVGEYLDFVNKQKQASQAVQTVKPSQYAEEAKKIYNSLSEAERRNFNVFLNNRSPLLKSLGKPSLENITDAEFKELLRLSNRAFQSTPSSLTPFSNTTTIDGTSLVNPGFSLTQLSKWQY